MDVRKRERERERELREIVHLRKLVLEEER